ncbi:MAG: polymerase sigma factor, sigma-70 family [Gemmatimonadetes bacterium]|nr:polymerase sigma factor, sigma-70 family [Gemmatimonadota bacterium]
MTRVALAIEPTSAVTEPELIARVVAGDRVAARSLYDAHAPRIYRLAVRLVGDDEVARELTQETFVRAFRQLPRFRGDSALGTWLHRIALSVGSDTRRRLKRRSEHETTLLDEHDVASTSVEADPDLKERLHAAIGALPEIYRTTFVMHDLEGFTHGEIAEVLGVAEGTCKSRLFAARAQLREALSVFMKE